MRINENIAIGLFNGITSINTSATKNRAIEA
jgi:hypothetical protein